MNTARSTKQPSSMESICHSRQARIRTLMTSAAVSLMLAMPMTAHAAMFKWTDIICRAISVFSDTIAIGIGVLCFFGAAIMIAMGETKGWMSGLITVLFGISLAVAAAPIVDAVFGNKLHCDQSIPVSF